MSTILFRVFVIISALLMASSVCFAQAGTPTDKFEQDLQLMRKDLRSDKKQFIAANMTLTEAEAVKFWPVYDRYAVDLSKIYDQRIELIKEYASNFEKLTDASASAMNKKWNDNERAMSDLRQRYIPMLEQVLPGKKAARFFQLERRLALLIDLQLAAEIPIVSQ